MFKRWFIKKYAKEIQSKSAYNMERILIRNFISLYLEGDKITIEPLANFFLVRLFFFPNSGVGKIIWDWYM